MGEREERKTRGTYERKRKREERMKRREERGQEGREDGRRYKENLTVSQPKNSNSISLYYMQFC